MSGRRIAELIINGRPGLSAYGLCTNQIFRWEGEGRGRRREWMEGKRTANPTQEKILARGRLFAGSGWAGTRGTNKTSHPTGGGNMSEKRREHHHEVMERPVARMGRRQRRRHMCPSFFFFFFFSSLPPLYLPPSPLTPGPSISCRRKERWDGWMDALGCMQL